MNVEGFSSERRAARLARFLPTICIFFRSSKTSTCADAMAALAALLQVRWLSHLPGFLKAVTQTVLAGSIVPFPDERIEDGVVGSRGRLERHERILRAVYAVAMVAVHGRTEGLNDPNRPVPREA